MTIPQVTDAIKMAWDYYWAKTFHRFQSVDSRRDEESVQGKIVIVTGANIGLGKNTCLQMAKRGAVVIMACRNLEKGQRALKDIQAEAPGGELHLMKVDLCDFDSVRAFAEQVIKKFPHINILINNAGCMDSSGVRLKTEIGFEMHMHVNFLAHFLLTVLFLDHLKKGAPSRILFLGSTLFRLAKFDVDDFMTEKTNFLGFLNLIPYNNSKLANILLARELSKRLEGTNVHTYSLCPGLVRTELFRNDQNYTKSFNKFIMFFGGLNINKGCETILYTALSKECAHESGHFYRFRRPWVKASKQLDSTAAEKLWTASAELVQLKEEKQQQQQYHQQKHPSQQNSSTTNVVVQLDEDDDTNDIEITAF